LPSLAKEQQRLGQRCYPAGDSRNRRRNERKEHASPSGEDGRRMHALLEAWMELVDPSEAAGLPGATEEALGSNGAPVLLPVLPDVLPQHLVLLRRPRPLLHPLLPVTTTATTVRRHPRSRSRHRQQPRPSSWAAPSSSQRPVLPGLKPLDPMRTNAPPPLVRRFREVWPSGRELGNGFVAAVGLGS
jgi:hypothetical protein